MEMKSPPLTFFLRSLGCKVSQYDGNRLEEKLCELGLVPVREGEAPDIFLLNGCAVTGRASQKVRQAVRAARRQWPLAKVIVTGCEARRRELSVEKSIASSFPLSSPQQASSVSAFLDGPRDEPLDAHGVLPVGADLQGIRDCLEACGLTLCAAGDIPQEAVPSPGGVLSIAHEENSHNSEAIPFSMKKVGARTRAFLKIQDGCRQFCTYCIVPHLRGAETSKAVEEAVSEARRLAAAGFRELVVTGIHVGHYAFGLTDLLCRLEAIDGIDRLRLSSIEPLEIDEALIEWMATSPKACQHLHIPLQAGHDAILAAMNRPYRRDAFAALIERIRRRIPQAGLTTDLIVGFPGETDEQFAEGVAFVEAMAFSRIHIFRYSTRPGTPAAGFSGQIAGPVKQARARAVEAVWHKLAERFAASLVGRNIEVLWETCVSGVWHGLSREYVSCRLAAAALPIGMIGADLGNVITSVRAVENIPEEQPEEGSLQHKTDFPREALRVVPLCVPFERAATIFLDSFALSEPDEEQS
ncbi:MAG: MiaB/RimO family radical SAM methylthiotransferase [Candidatus Ozemobacteraceae bacterium]